MVQERSLTKRQLLKYSVGSLSALLAGCGGQSDPSGTTTLTDTETESTPTTTPTQTPTETATTTRTTTAPALEPVAEEFLTALGDREYQAAADLLSSAGERQIEDYVPGFLNVPFTEPVPALQRAWLGLTAQHRGFEEIRDLSTDPETGVVTGTLACAEADQGVRLTVSDDETIRRVEFPSEYSAPEYVSSDEYREQSVSFESDEREFEGTLTLPADAETAPCVVLVQGAGIFDRDATVGPNKTFRDIAHGLASQGVATYRYDRRRPDEVSGEFTPANFVVDDAVAAVERVAEVDAVQSDALYVAGHSQGGRFTPQIAETHGGLAGMVILDTIGYGYLESRLVAVEAFLSSEYATGGEQERARRLRERVEDLQQNGLPESGRVLGRSLSWVKANLEYDRIATANGAGVPTFVVHGGRGVGDKRASLERWESGIDTEGSRFSFYDDLNHYLQPVDPPSLGPDIFLFHDNVSERVIGDVADWIVSR